MHQALPEMATLELGIWIGCVPAWGTVRVFEHPADNLGPDILNCAIDAAIQRFFKPLYPRSGGIGGFNLIAGRLACHTDPQSAVPR